MKRLRTIFFIGIVSLLSFYSLEAADQSVSRTISLPELPIAVQEIIIDFLTQDIAKATHNEPSLQEDTRPKWRSVREYRYIQRIFPLNGVCRKFHAFIRPIIIKRFANISASLHSLGDIDRVLSEAVDGYSSDLIKACVHAGADINAIKYTGNNIILAKYQGKETLLTQAIKKGDASKVKKLLSLGANPMLPNALGEVPIDIAFKRSYEEIAVILKENGGDLDNHYKYYCKDAVSSIDTYTPKRAAVLAWQQKNKIHLSKKYFKNKLK